MYAYVQKDVEYIAFAVESEANSFNKCKEHCDNNNVKCTLKLASVSPSFPISAIMNEISQISGSASSLIDYMDLDIQGHELSALLEGGLMPLLHARLKRIHIGTHSPQRHAQLKKAFLEAQWTLTIDYQWGYGEHTTDGVTVVAGCTKAGMTTVEMPGDQSIWDGLQQSPKCMQQTSFGPVYVRDGLLGFVNPTLVPKVQFPVEKATPYQKSCEWPNDLRGCAEWMQNVDDKALHLGGQ